MRAGGRGTWEGEAGYVGERAWPRSTRRRRRAAASRAARALVDSSARRVPWWAASHASRFGSRPLERLVPRGAFRRGHWLLAPGARAA
ncbi:hypothetical protein GUJ93_ZPchr0007g5035 [Zizania palustris]|uniref:Uncharacterized protein n=1 Tax=Zizania palustris TaxID=103762 RepID=A0A8J5T5G5_ZIZPA|nr:hypothetical protein GUJ93_ZPchr0007g5035 [Zizania palustris]